MGGPSHESETEHEGPLEAQHDIPDESQPEEADYLDYDGLGKLDYWP